MMLRIVGLWVLGAIVIVPASIYCLLFYAQPDDYAFLIVVPLFWIFGFWGVVGPLIAALRVHKLFSALDKAKDKHEALEAFDGNEGKQVMIDLIASEARIPRFLARILYKKVVCRLAKIPAQQAQHQPSPPGDAELHTR